jgi:hypothetical protein
VLRILNVRLARGIVVLTVCGDVRLCQRVAYIGAPHTVFASKISQRDRPFKGTTMRRMAMGNRKRDRQPAMWVTITE